MMNQTFLQSIGMLAIVALLSACSESGSSDNTDTETDSVTDSDTSANGGSDSNGDTGAPPDTDKTLDECFADVSNRDDSWFTVVQDFSSNDNALQVRVAYSEAGSGVGETFLFDLVRLGIQNESGTLCISDEAKLAYKEGHHNWHEELVATAGNIEHVVTMEYVWDTEASWTNRYIERTTDGTEVNKANLNDVNCRTIPAGEPNACMRRPRDDI